MGKGTDFFGRKTMDYSVSHGSPHWLRYQYRVPNRESIRCAIKARTAWEGRGVAAIFGRFGSISLLVLTFLSMGTLAWDEQNPCAHHDYPDMGKERQMSDGQSVHVEQMPANATHRYFFSTYSTSLMHERDMYRKLIINLEPCKGVVYLFVRKTRKCYPNPYSCINLGTNTLQNPDDCEWTHYMSVVDGTRDGAPTFFELPLTSTKYYISVFSREIGSSYTITMLTNVGAWPRPGYEGRLSAVPLQELQVQIMWDTAYYRPTGISNTYKYWVFSALLLPSDERTNAAVFLKKNKIMNTVCGLVNNTDREVASISANRCNDGKCKVTIDGVVTGKRYVFNVIAESDAGYNMSYAGLILQTDYTVERRAASEKTLQVVGAIAGAILGMVIIIYVWMIQLYGK